jgi:hypothetical protein
MLARDLDRKPELHPARQTACDSASIGDNMS